VTHGNAGVYTPFRGSEAENSTNAVSGSTSLQSCPLDVNPSITAHNCRDGNKWSYDYCRRQWSLVDADHLRFRFLNAWDAAMQRLDEEYSFLSSSHQIVSHADDTEQVRSCSLVVVPLSLPWTAQIGNNLIRVRGGFSTDVADCAVAGMDSTTIVAHSCDSRTPSTAACMSYSHLVCRPLWSDGLLCSCLCPRHTKRVRASKI